MESRKKAKKPRIVQALIYGEDGRGVVDGCSGPDRFGRCPRAALGQPVACAGRRIEATRASGIPGWRFLVLANAESCPLAALGVNRVR